MATFPYTLWYDWFELLKSAYRLSTLQLLVLPAGDRKSSTAPFLTGTRNVYPLPLLFTTFYLSLCSIHYPSGIFGRYKGRIHKS
jgi:hypothetical protein